eukprot:6343044-Pyramimonas_sp.AAC.1
MSEEYFEQVQWQVTYATLVPSGHDDIGDTLPIYTGAFGMQEFQDALRAFATVKAAGVDDIAPELYTSEPCGELLAFFQKCWSEQDIPREWYTSIVALLHKKEQRELPRELEADVRKGFAPCRRPPLSDNGPWKSEIMRSGRRREAVSRI